MNPTVEYLLAQARRRPLAAARFAAGEFLRRRRLAAADGGARPLPEFCVARARARLRALLPEEVFDESALRRAAGGREGQLLLRAEGVLRREFEIFGERVCLGSPLDWHEDWQSGHRWPLAPPGELPLTEAAPGADVKRPWELARFHHALALGMGWRVTRDPRFAEAFVALVGEWLDANPAPLGIHWAMPMEAALRAAGWAAAAGLLEDAPALNDAFWKSFLASLLAHARHIAAHAEWNPVARGNHYLGCVVGLAACGAVFADLEEGRRWLVGARAALLREMEEQVGEDGVAHEGSSSYHVYLAELFLTGALMLARHAAVPGLGAKAALQAALGADFCARLEKMFGFIAALLEGREHPPNWGDRDDGRVLPMCFASSGGNDEPAAHLLAAGRALFRRGDWPAGCPSCAQPFWMLGDCAGPPSHSAARPGSREFRDAGFYFFSSHRLRGSLRCGPLGVRGWANHAHCDQLSFELCADGAPIVVDPGTYLYSGDPVARNLFRSTQYHNVPCVAGCEQNRFWPGLLFRMMDDARCRLLYAEDNGEHFALAGQHFGYRRLPQRVRAVRSFTLGRRAENVSVCDILDGRGRVPVEWNLHLAPGIEPRPVAGAPDLIPDAAREWMRGPNGGAPPVLRGAWRIGPLMLRVWCAAPLACEVAEGWVAPRYAARRAAAILRWRCEAALPLRLLMDFCFS